jgi:phenylacetic acid degradation operon negative regulatory protein
VEIGELFGLTGNAVRVSVTRLLGAGLLESDERGSYRLSARAAPLSAHVEAWRLGERRVRPWNGEWLSVWLPRSAPRSRRAQSERALGLVGHRAGLAGIWVRPDNLAESPEATARKLAELGLEAEARSFRAHDFDAELVELWKRELWQTKTLVAAQRAMRQRLEQSRRKIHCLPVGPAAVETFLLGGAAIRLLSTDPLLPSEIADTAERAALTAAMLDYDRAGRGIWAKLGSEIVHQAAPAHLSLVGGAA